MVIFLAYLLHRFALLNGQLTVPQSPRHISIFRIPRRRLCHPPVFVVIIEGRYLPYQGGYLRVLFYHHLPDATDPNLGCTGKVRVGPVPDALERAVTQVIAMLPAYLRYLTCKE